MKSIVLALQGLEDPEELLALKVSLNNVDYN
jgi:hypothetical protein